MEHLSAYIERFGADLMGAMLTAGFLLCCSAVVVVICLVFADDIHEAIRRNAP
jgi:hypothetical protein